MAVVKGSDICTWEYNYIICLCIIGRWRVSVLMSDFTYRSSRYVPNVIEPPYIRQEILTLLSPVPRLGSVVTLSIYINIPHIGHINQKLIYSRSYVSCNLRPNYKTELA
uniref:Uncharacterized protein n=1 Tax=Cacopsylla melanoneura TaxID=428564 RepID=A0A8D8LXX3_9HEMI